MRRAKGFTLVELAVVVTIVALLLSSLLYTLSAQTEQRNFEETRRRLEQARELVLSYAIVNGRLPCPARSAATTVAPIAQPGEEVRNAAGQCNGDTGAGAVDDYYGGANGAVTLGLLPAKTIGFVQTNAAGVAVDVWGNPIRYAVARNVVNCWGAPTNPHFVNAANLKANGVACQPADLLVCRSATGVTAANCGGSANQVMTASTVVAIIFSTGKNGALGAGGADEATNIKTNGALAPQINPIFVFHTPQPAGAANGEFDDQMIWISVGELYSRMIAAGVLP